MGQSLKDVVRNAHGMSRTASLPVDHEDKVHPPWVLPRHNAWMQLPESQRVWTPEAISFASLVHQGKLKHERKGRVSPSALGDNCERALLFGFAQAPQVPFPRENAEKMYAGEFHHLRWQMEGLSAGYMKRGEVWLHAEALRCGGSGDGLLVDGSLFELKSTAEHLFKCAREMTKAPEDRNPQRFNSWDYFMGMHRKHKLQMEAYWLVDEVGAAERGEPRVLNDWGSLVYQDAGNPGNIVEFRLHSAPTRRTEVNRILESLHDWIDIKDLPDMLDGCRKAVFGAQEGEEPATQKEVTVYDRCPFREICPNANPADLL